MKLQQLYINKNIKCKFQDGVNIILGCNIPDKDDSKSSEQGDTNGVGKTMIVNSIRYCLGLNVSHIFSLDYFEKKKYWPRLEVMLNGEVNVFMRPMWNSGNEKCFIYNGHLDELNEAFFKQAINLDATEDIKEIQELPKQISNLNIFNLKEFKLEISRLQNIDYSRSNIQYSALLDYIIRDEKKGYSDIITTPKRIQWVQYRSMQYLFNLPATLEKEIADQVGSCKKKKAEYDEKKNQLQARAINSIDSIENKKISLRRHLEEIQDQIKEITVTPAIEDIREEYQKKRTALTTLNKDISKKETYRKNYKAALQAITDKEKSIQNLLSLDQFYKDLVSFFPEQLKKNIDDFNSFFSSIGKDRRSYYNELINEINRAIGNLRGKKTALSNELNILGKRLSGTDIVSDISILAAKEEKLHFELKDLSNMEQYLEKGESLLEKIKEIKDKIDDFLKEGKANEKAMRQKRKDIIKFFKNAVERVYGTREGGLEFNLNSNSSSETMGRTEINCWIPSQSSLGRSNALIVLFDLTWFLREREGEFDPGFLIHDGPYVVISDDIKPKLLSYTKQMVEDKNKQYIITANEGDIPDLEKYGSCICCRLDGSSQSGKFFKEQFSDRCL